MKRKKKIYKFKELKDITFDYKTLEKGYVEHKELSPSTEIKFIPDYEVLDEEEEELEDYFTKLNCFPCTYMECYGNYPNISQEEKLKSIDDNAQLALEFTKEFNECIEKHVPKECAALAVLHDLADWKDQHPRKGLWDANKVINYIYEHAHVRTFGDIVLDDMSVTEFIETMKKAMED